MVVEVARTQEEIEAAQQTARDVLGGQSWRQVERNDFDARQTPAYQHLREFGRIVIPQLNSRRPVGRDNSMWDWANGVYVAGGPEGTNVSIPYSDGSTNTAPGEQRFLANCAYATFPVEGGVEAHGYAIGFERTGSEAEEEDVVDVPIDVLTLTPERALVSCFAKEHDVTLSPGAIAVFMTLHKRYIHTPSIHLSPA